MRTVTTLTTDQQIANMVEGRPANDTREEPPQLGWQDFDVGPVNSIASAEKALLSVRQDLAEIERNTAPGYHHFLDAEERDRRASVVAQLREMERQAEQHVLDLISYKYERGRR